MLESINMGHELNVISWIKDGKANLIEFGDRETSGMTEDTLPHQAREIFPSVFYSELETTVKDYLMRVAKYCGIQEGPLSMQFFYDHGSLSVGEVCGRFFGYGQGIIPVINGLDPNELLLNMLYAPENNTLLMERTNRYADHCSIALYPLMKHGIIRDLGNIPSFQNKHVDEFKIYAKPGYSTDCFTWPVRVYAHFDTRQEADEYTNSFYRDLFVPDLNGNNLVITNRLMTYED